MVDVYRRGLVTVPQGGKTSPHRLQVEMWGLGWHAQYAEVC